MRTHEPAQSFLAGRLRRRNALPAVLARIAVVAVVVGLTGCGGSTASPARAQPAAERAVVRDFWRDLRLGQAGVAFALLTPAEQQRVGGLGAWVAGYRVDPVTASSLRLGRATPSGIAVTVRVVRKAGGCRILSGRYDLVHPGRRWLIGYAELGESACAP
jgi:hypothetical protein